MKHNPNPLMYRKSRLELLFSGRECYHFKLDYSKGYTWAAFKDKSTGAKFITFSTHYWWKETGAERPVKNSAGKANAGSFWTTFKALLHKMARTAFVVVRKDEELLRFPTLLLALLAIFGFWFTVPALLVGMALGCRYRFEGKGETSAAANRAMDDIQAMVYSAREKVEQTVKESKNKAK